MIDPSIRQLLEQAIDSPIKLQLLLMFHENTRLEATASQIANRIYRDIWSTRDALRELCEDGVLSTVGDGSDPRYTYRPCPEHVDRISHLVQSYNEPIERDHVQRALREVADDALYRRARAKSVSAFELQMM